MMVGPSLGSLLTRYNPWLPWMMGESLSFLNILTSLLLPNTTPELVSDNSSAHASSTETEGAGEGAQPKSGPHLRIETILASTLRFLSNAKQFVGKKQQVLLLLSIALMGQLGSDSLLTMILLYISKRYHWSFANVSDPTFLKEIFHHSLTLPFEGWPFIVSGSWNTACSAADNTTFGQSHSVISLQTLCRSCR